MLHQTKLDIVEIGYDEQGIQNKIYIFIGFYKFYATVTELLNEYADKIIAVRGNCDSEVDEMVLDFPMMSTYSSILYNGRRLFLTHGHKFHEENLPPLKAGDVFFYGHTHVPLARKQGDIFIINPGSITLPKEDNPNSYGVLDGNTFEIKDMEGRTFKTINFEL